MADRSTVARVAGLLALLGGALLVVGALRTWIEVPEGPIGFEGGVVDDAAAGVDSALGVVALVAGVVAVAGGLACLVGRYARPAALAAAVAGLVGLGIVVLSAATLDDRFVDASSASAPEGEGARVERLVDGLLANDTISTRAALGLWVTGAGGLLALVGGALAAAGRTGRRRGAP